MNNVDYRYHKDFEGVYVDESGMSSNRTYSIFVRDLERNIKTDVNPGGELLWKDGLYKGDRPYVNSGLRTIEANKMFKFLSKIIKEGSSLGNFYYIGV